MPTSERDNRHRDRDRGDNHRDREDRDRSHRDHRRDDRNGHHRDRDDKGRREGSRRREEEEENRRGPDKRPRYDVEWMNQCYDAAAANSKCEEFLARYVYNSDKIYCCCKKNVREECCSLLVKMSFMAFFVCFFCVHRTVL